MSPVPSPFLRPNLVRSVRPGAGFRDGPRPSTGPRPRGLPYLIVGVGADVFAVPFLQVREVVSATALAVERAASPGSAGVLVRHGRAVPLFDLRVLLATPEPAPLLPRGVVVSAGLGAGLEAPVGVLVDSVGPVVTLAATDLSPVDAFGETQSDFLLGIGRVNGARRRLLEVARLLPALRPPPGNRRG
jgi:chemotaxis signal transduction protein